MEKFDENEKENLGKLPVKLYCLIKKLCCYHYMLGGVHARVETKEMMGEKLNKVRK